MQKVRYLSLIVLLILVLYLAATALFAWLFRVRSEAVQITRTPAPTFTPVPPTAVVVIPTATPSPTATSTPTIAPSPTPVPDTPTPVPPTPTPTPTPGAQLAAANTVNVRSGPGTNYPVVAALPPNLVVPITGRNNEASWWQISNADGASGWVANSVVQASNTANVPLVVAPPPPATPTPAATPTPEKPKYQFEPTGWYADTNYGLTRFLGNITDPAGNPVNGVYVQASCGGFSAISNPSGPIGGLNGEGAFWPPGFYDITLATKPVPCKWVLTIVTTNDQRTATGALSEPIEVEVTYDKSIVTANWRKNW
ncbi:MAG: SH3 domain-containing protein [Anaerolineae bacterium]|nr:SH3 domain-containing protein [Anaerolineae bacterium]